MARGLVPQRQSIDQGVDLTVLKFDKKASYLSYQVKGCTNLERMRGGYGLAYMVPVHSVKNLEGLDLNYLLMTEKTRDTDKSDRKFLTIPGRAMKKILKICGRLRQKKSNVWKTEYYKMDIWMDKEMEEFWVLDTKGKKQIDISKWIEAWDAVV